MIQGSPDVYGYGIRIKNPYQITPGKVDKPREKRKDIAKDPVCKKEKRLIVR